MLVSMTEKTVRPAGIMYFSTDPVLAMPDGGLDSLSAKGTKLGNDNPFFLYLGPRLSFPF